MPEPRNAGPHPRGAAVAGGAAGPAVVGGGKDCLQQPWPHRGSKGPQQTAKCCPLPHVVGQAGVCSASSRKRLSRLQFCALQVANPNTIAIVALSVISTLFLLGLAIRGD